MAKEVSAVDEKIARKRDRLEKYGDVVELANLSAVQMTSVKFSVKPEFFANDDHRNLSYTIDKGTMEYLRDQKAGMAFLSLKVEAKSGRKRTLYCEAEYLVTYDNLIDLNEEAVVAFLDRVAPFACYPYFRSLFANLDWAATTGLPPLPVHKEPARPRVPNLLSAANTRPKRGSQEG
ncbi:hypothetical protein NKH74_24110 [Mesorhizobium sp. M0933]|uniref:hypothetical protein n=1 Tax=Mesorhizobium sp. M0933 TaxID=2957030 RepID=UPI00333AFBDB